MIQDISWLSCFWILKSRLFLLLLLLPPTPTPHISIFKVNTSQAKATKLFTGQDPPSDPLLFFNILVKVFKQPLFELARLINS